MGNTMWLILDAMGVMFLQENDLKEVFMPYLKKHAPMFYEGSITRQIESVYLQLTLGKINSDQFFRQLNIKQPDMNFFMGVTLDSTFRDFANEIRKSHRLAVLSNDSHEWANHRNSVLRIQAYINHYITSSLLGVRKPSIMAFKKMYWLLDVDPKSCIYVDNLVSNLHPANELGMRVVLFRRDGKNDSPYPLVRSFSELKQIISGG